MGTSDEATPSQRPPEHGQGQPPPSRGYGSKQAGVERAEVPFWVNVVHEFFEISSFVFIIAAGIVAYVEYREHAKQEREQETKEHVEAAERAYTEVDVRYGEFVKVCLQYPELDCYSVPDNNPAPPSSVTDQLHHRQQMAFTMLTDVFEVAFTRYHNPIYREALNEYVNRQWPGWVTYMRKFVVRSDYLTVWHELRDEYDTVFVSCLDAMEKQRAKLTRDEFLVLQMPNECR
jgi:hypothetical protein